MEKERGIGFSEKGSDASGFQGKGRLGIKQRLEASVLDPYRRQEGQKELRGKKKNGDSVEKGTIQR